jgi:hypothetical protein
LTSSTFSLFSESNSCVLCALTHIFIEFAHGSADSGESMSISSLRHALSNTYQNQARFQLQQMDDAAEVYEAILESIHVALSPDSILVEEDSGSKRFSRHSHTSDDCHPECLAHRTLFLPVEECNARGAPVVFYNKAVHYVSILTLVEKGELAKKSPKKVVLKFDIPVISYDADGQVIPESSAVIKEDTLIKKRIPHPDFGKLLGEVIAGDSPRGGQGETLKPQVSKDAQVFVAGLNWPSANSSVSNLESLLDLLCPVIEFNDIFSEGMLPSKSSTGVHNGTKSRTKSGSLRTEKKGKKEKKEKSTGRPMILCGMICYYGQHYSAFVFSPDIREWTLFDDTMVKSIGPHWSDLITKCKTGHYQPSLLFYQKCTPEAAKAEKDLFDLCKKSERKFEAHRKRALSALVPPSQLSTTNKKRSEPSAEKVRPLFSKEEALEDDAVLAKCEWLISFPSSYDYFYLPSF